MEGKEDCVWDYYDIKLLKSLVVKFSFDFNEISKFFKQSFKNKEFSSEECRQKWIQIHQNSTKDTLYSSRFSEICNDLPLKRKPTDALKISEVDLNSQQTIAEDGSIIFPNGKFLWRFIR